MLRICFEMGVCHLFCFKPFYLLTLVRQIFCEENVSWLHQGFQTNILEHSSPRGLHIHLKSSRMEGVKTSKTSWGSHVTPATPAPQLCQGRDQDLSVMTDTGVWNRL